ncbi:MAG: DUF5686 family protein [Bacteroidales bacterium]
MGNLNKHILFILICLLLPFVSLAQETLRGRVTDSVSGNPMAFVNVVYNQERQGTTTDLDGYFSVPDKSKADFLKCSFVGYDTKRIPVPKAKDYVEIQLKPKAFQLDEVTVLPGENPAHRIIKNAVAMRDEHAPHKLDNYQYTSYSKFYMTLQTDSMKKKIERDTAGRIPDTSSLVKTVDFFDKNHLFMMESVTEKQFVSPDREEEHVVGSRVSGLKKPAFTYLASEYQSFSFYRQSIEVGGQEFVSPLCKNSHTKYFFLLRDSLFNPQGDTSFVISFKPKRGTNFKGLQGRITITSDHWAIENVIAEPMESSGSFDIKIQQKYEKVDSVHWFPVQLNTNFILRFASASSNSLSIGSTEDPQSTAPMIGVGKTYIRDIRINRDSSERVRGGTSIVYDKKLAERDSLWWKQQRQEQLDNRETETYRLIDSVGEEIKLDHMVEIMEILATGSIPWGVINIKLNDLFWYNEYEGYRLGLGLETNKRLSEYFSLHGYGAYGFRDKELKYGGGLSLYPLKNKRLEINTGWSHDLRAGNQLNFQTSMLSTESFRYLFIDEMDWYDTWSASIESNPFRGFYAKTYLDFNQIKINNSRRFYSEDLLPEFSEWESGVELHWIIKENIIRTPKGNMLSMGSKYPEIFFNLRYGFPHQMNTYEYWRFEARITDVIETRWIGDFHLTLDAAYLHSDRNPYLQKFYLPGSGKWLDSDRSFATMRPHEFHADRYLAAFFKYDIGSMLFHVKKWKPEFALVTNACIGEVDAYPLAENEILYQSHLTPKKGYIESGIQFNALLRQSFIKYGAGFYYHYGPYSTPHFKDNYAIKLRMEFAF